MINLEKIMNSTLTDPNLWFAVIAAALLFIACMGFSVCIFECWFRRNV